MQQCYQQLNLLCCSVDFKMAGGEDFFFSQHKEMMHVRGNGCAWYPDLTQKHCPRGLKELSALCSCV